MNAAAPPSPYVRIGGEPVVAAIVNRFWLDPRTGFVWKSDQWAGPAGRVRIEVLKPPA